MRYVILIALIVAVILLYRWRRRHKPWPPAAKTDQPSAHPSSPIRSVRCAACGLAVPEKEAVRLNGETFCSIEHARDWQERHHR